MALASVKNTRPEFPHWVVMRNDTASVTVGANIIETFSYSENCLDPQKEAQAYAMAAKEKNPNLFFWTAPLHTQIELAPRQYVAKPVK